MYAKSITITFIYLHVLCVISVILFHEEGKEKIDICILLFDDVYYFSCKRLNCRCLMLWELLTQYTKYRASVAIVNKLGPLFLRISFEFHGVREQKNDVQHPSLLSLLVSISSLAKTET